MKVRLCLALFILVPAVASAQSFEEFLNEARDELSRFRTESRDDFDAYRKKINDEFAEYMSRLWTEFESEPAEPEPVLPEPPKPVVKRPGVLRADNPVPFKTVIPSPVPLLPPRPAVPLPEISPAVPVSFSFMFYGAACTVPLDESHRFVIGSISERSVSRMWKRLSSDDFLPVIQSCLEWRDRLKLCDWAYYRFLCNMTESFFGGEYPDEACLLQMYIMTISGYRVRLSRCGDRLVLLIPSEETVYGYPYVNVGGRRCYVMEKAGSQAQYHVFDREFPEEQPFSFRIADGPSLPERASDMRTLASLRYPEIKVRMAVNRNLIDFYNDYPHVPWDYYAQASLSVGAMESLYPVLLRTVGGKPEAIAADMLIDFVQTALEYMTDEEQFGAERPLFADETLYYPYSDCEDRAILYAALVRDLLGLDVLLVHYPGHLATAVHFNENVTGDYLIVDGERFVICDPTYIGAPIGEAMPQFKNATVDLIRIR